MRSTPPWIPAPTRACLARQVVDYLRALLLIQMGNVSEVDMAADTRNQAEKHAKAFSPAMDVLAHDQILQYGCHRPAWRLAAIPAVGIGRG